MANRSSYLHVVRISVESASAPAVETALELASIPMSQWIKVDKGVTVFQSFHEKSREATALAAFLRAGMKSLLPGGRARVSIARIANKDWKESWKKGFKTEKISARITIKPSWAKPLKQKTACVIELDPGMSFGTGRHFTTRFCLRMIDKLALRLPGASFCDLGCGSGVLSIAAAKLGFSNIHSIDIDPSAVMIAKENLELNGVGDKVKCLAASVSDARFKMKFQVIAANLDSPTLTSLSGVIPGLFQKGCVSHLILSGLTPSQYPAIKKLYGAAGFKESYTAKSREWQSGLFVR